MKYIVFYDGVCGLCNRSVRLLIKLDRKRVLRYASIQSDFAKTRLKDKNLDISSGTIIFLADYDLYIKSNAILRILMSLKGIYRLAVILYIIPRPVRDAIYDWISRNRYRWFGKHETCPMPQPGDSELFIDI